MSTDTAHATGQTYHPRHFFQYYDFKRQYLAAKFGMWLFLAQEVLFFAALLCSYAFYRNQFPTAWHHCSEHLEHVKGAIETVDLLVSSYLIAMSIHFIRQGKTTLTAICIFFTIVCGGVFLVMHGTEYYKEYTEGFLPGKFFHGEISDPGAPMFFTVYFFLTGVHSAHVLIGMGVLTWLLIRTLQGRFDPAYNTPVELIGLYWHIVDLIWIFLFPLLYLVG